MLTRVAKGPNTIATPSSAAAWASFRQRGSRGAIDFLGMRLEYQQNLRMEQRLVQSPQMIQAMQILQLTTPELLDRIEAEIEENPFLETGEDTDDESGPDPTANGSEGAADAGEDGVAVDEVDERSDDVLEDHPALGEIDRLLTGGTGSTAGEPDQQFDSVQNLAAPDSRSVDGVLAELRVSDADEELLHAAELVLSNLDPRGFLPDGLQGLAEVTGADPASLELGLERLRELAHPALGAVDLRDCYRLQLEALPGQYPVADALVRDHFDDLLANRLPQIAKALNVSLSQVREALDVLRGFDSRPLSDYEFDETLPILPDVIVEPEPDGRYRAVLARDGLPELRLSRSAHQALQRAKGDKRLYNFLLQKIERARWFLDAVAQRRETLRKISQALVDRQREFLDYGPERLQPLKMQEVADMVGVHISTVSRAIRGKFAQTPQGILPLKGFFSGGQRTSSGGQRSRVAIQERIKEIIDAEDKSAPLSDEEIVKILSARDGVKVARRTVTKYRKALSIPASTLRRSY